MDAIFIQLSGWVVAFVTGIWATWVAFSSKKKDEMLVEVKAILEDEKVEIAEIVDFIRKWINTQNK